MDDLDPGVKLPIFYGGKDESGRLLVKEGRVEYLRTQEILRHALVPGSRILDVGGADGVHASWFQQDGFEVEVVDIVPLHVERARKRGLRATLGDARELGYDDASFDAVLLLGPLYHLIDAVDRSRALAEAHRVVKPHGVVAAAAITRIAVALDFLRRGHLVGSEAQKEAARIAATGRDHAAMGAEIFYFHTVAELRNEMEAARFSDVEIRGVEGPAWPLIDRACPPDDPIIAQVVDIAAMADGDDSLTGASAHLIGIARA